MSNSNGLKTWKGLSSQTIIVIIMGVLELSFFSIMSRLLNKEDFGYFAVISAVTVIFSGLSEAGFGAASIQKKNPSESYINTAFSLSIIIGSVFSLLMFFSADLLSKLTVQDITLANGFRISSIMLLFLTVNSLGRSVFMRRLDFMKYGLIQILSYSLSAAVGIFLAVKGFEVYSVVWATVLNPLIMFICLLSLGAIRFKFCYSRQSAKEILTFGGWLTGSTILRSLNTQIDKLIMTRWLPISALGMYSRPSGFISSGVDKVNSIFDVVLFPILSNIQEDKSKIVSSYYRCVTLVQLFSVVITCLLLLGSELIINVFLGEQWLDVNTVFLIISVSTIFVCYGRIADCYFRSLGEVKSYFFRRLIVLFSTIFCVYVGCQFGIIGLSLAVLISCIIDALIRWIFLVHIIRFSAKEMILKMLRISVLPCFFLLIIWPIKNGEISGSIISVVIFLLLFLASAFFFPKLYGDIFYYDIYSKFIKK